MEKVSKRNMKTSQKKKKSLTSSGGACPKILASERGRGLFESTHDLVQIFTPEGELLEVNPAWKEHLGYLGDDYRHLSFFNVLHSKDKVECGQTFESVLKTGIDQKVIVTFVNKRGKELVVEGTVSSLACQGKGCALRGVFRDVTQKRRYENLKDDFVSTISHELRTPLTVVREGVSQLQDGLFGALSGDQKSLLSVLLQNVDRLGHIIAALLNVSELEAGQMRVQRSLFNIVDIAREVAGDFKAVAQQRNLQLRVLPQKEKIDLYIDRNMISHLLTHLISNALKFTEKGAIEIRLSEQDDFVECKVADTGRGISSPDISRIFEKFRQIERDVGPGEKGTGLGLSISKKLVELHHGRIQVSSTPGQGTTVTFLLPKYTRRELFKEYIAEAMSRSFEEGNPLSIVIFDIVDFDTLQNRVGAKRLAGIVVTMEKVINHALRRAADIAIKDDKAILVLLPDTKKEHAHIVLGRLYQVLEDCLAQVKKTPKIEIHSSVACFPEDAETLEKILDKIYD